MRLPNSVTSLFAAFLLAALVAPAGAGVRLLATDDRGLNFEVTVDDWSLSAPAPSGRVSVLAPGAHRLGEPGRPALPAFAVTLALPPGADAVARVLAAEGLEAREGVRVATAGRPDFERDERSTGWVPRLFDEPAIVDGAWPPEAIVSGREFSMRGRRLVAIEVRPFRFDERAQRLEVTRRVLVRVDFSTSASAALRAVPAGPSDPHHDAVLETTVLNFDQARSWRVGPGGPSSFRSTPESVPGPHGAAAFDESDPEVRVKVDSTGLYWLLFDDLQPKGYPDGVPINEVSVHRHEYREGIDPPYTTEELAIEVEDFNTNNVFDAGDAIWLYARSWAARSGVGHGQRRWGDAEVVYVTRKAAGGRRMTTRSGWRNSVAPAVLTSYPWTQRFERNFEYTATPRDTGQDVFSWTGAPTFYYLRADTIRFETNHLDTTRSARLAVNFEGRDTGGHWMWGQVKNGSGQFTSVVDSVFFSGKGAFTPAAPTLNGSALSEGLTNTFRQWGKTFISAPDPTTNSQTNAVLNSLDLTYWRRFRALQNTLHFNSGDASGEFQLRGQGFGSNSIRLYDVTDPENPVRVTIAPAQLVNESGIGWAFDLQDSVATGGVRRYVASSSPEVVDASAYRAVTRRRLHDAPGADYLLVTPEAFLPAVQPLVDFRQAQGLRVLVAPLESVNDEFNGGRHSAYSIQRFVRFAYQKWDSRFLLLLGDGSQNPQAFGFGADPEFVPIRFIPAAVTTVEGAETITADPVYACVTGNCDPVSGLGGPVIPELFVGRLPVHSLTEAQQAIAKVIAYENLAGDQSWRRKVMLQSDDAYSGVSTFGNGNNQNNYCYRSYEEIFRSINEACSTVIRRDAGLAEVDAEVFNNRFYLANEPFTSAAPGDTCRPDLNATVPRARASIQPSMFSRLNEGRLWWNYQGHANQWLLAHEVFYETQLGGSDVSLFANDGRPFLWSAFSCHANAHAFMLRIERPQPEAIGAEMVLHPTRGAIASYASTGFEIIPRDPNSHINTYMARHLFQTPPRDAVLGERGARVILGEAIGAMLLAYLPTVQSFSFERGVSLTYNLLGDPATRLSIGQPQSLVTANSTPVTSGQPVRLHTPGDTLRLEADLVSIVRLDSLGLWERGAAGERPIPSSAYTVTPTFPDTGAGSVNGGRRYRLVHRTNLRAESYRYVIRVRDRDGLVTDFTVPFELRTILRVSGTPISDGDDVAPAADLSLQLLSPKPITDPQSELTLTVGGVAQAFTAVAAPGDASGREWILSWTHAPYPLDDYTVHLQVAGGGSVTRTFRVSTATGELALRNAMLFPNPFEDDLGAFFSFSLAGSEAVDVKIRVFTQAGRVVYERVERSLSPGYHQLAWDGRDAEGDKLANGVYFYRLSAVTPSGAKQEQLGRIVKLRKPRRVVEPTIP